MEEPLALNRRVLQVSGSDDYAEGLQPIAGRAELDRADNERICFSQVLAGTSLSALEHLYRRLLA